jgi:hypothetical protein
MKPGGTVYSPEFDLVLACLRWPQEAVDGDRIRTLAQRPIRWSHLLEIVDHHKVLPLFSRNLDTFAPGYMPDERAAALRARSVANAHICLRRAAHLVALHQLFREQQIDLRIFKGIPLAITAFRDPSLRDAGDIDLLVAEKDIFKAAEILQDQGYVRFEPQARLTPRRLRSYLAHQKDFSYEHPATGMVIDLHWRLFRNSFLPAAARLEEVGEDWIHLGSERIPTLPPLRLLLYLCVRSTRRLAAPEMAGRYRRSAAHHDAGTTHLGRDGRGRAAGVTAIQRRHSSLPRFAGLRPARLRPTEATGWVS